MGETGKYVAWIQHRSIRFTDVLYSAGQKSSKSLDLCSYTNADQILDFQPNAVRPPVCPAQTRHQLRGIVPNAWGRELKRTRGQFRSDRQRRA